MIRTGRRPYRATSLIGKSIDKTLRRIKLASLVNTFTELLAKESMAIRPPTAPAPGRVNFANPVPPPIPVVPPPAPTMTTNMTRAKDPAEKLASMDPISALRKKKEQELINASLADMGANSDLNPLEVSMPKDQLYLQAISENPKLLQNPIGMTTPLRDLAFGRRLPIKA